MEEGLPTVLEQGENSLSHPVTVAQENDDFGGLHESSLSGEDDISKVEDVCDWVEDGNDEENDRISLGMVGKLWSERVLNPTAFMTTIKNVWVTQHGVDVKMIGKNLFQFQFYHWRDKEKVMKGQPWHFDKVALLLADMDEALKSEDIQFVTLPIWVRMYNIPFRGRCNEANARMMGEKIGDVLEVNKSDFLGMEKSIRIRVGLDVRKPLRKNVMIKVRGGDIVSCPVK